jgi:hypothetical protein
MELQVGDIVQIDPDVEMFGGCFVTVNEVSGSRVMAYAQVPGGGQAYVFLQPGKFALTGGVAKWVAGNV